MHKLTKKEKATILKAADLIARRKKAFCCHAIVEAEGKEWNYLRGTNSALIKKFKQFYGKRSPHPWFEWCSPKEQDQRLQLLLLFAEAG